MEFEPEECKKTHGKRVGCLVHRIMAQGESQLSKFVEARARRYVVDVPPQTVQVGGRRRSDGLAIGGKIRDASSAYFCIPEQNSIPSDVPHGSRFLFLGIRAALGYGCLKCRLDGAKRKVLTFIYVRGAFLSTGVVCSPFLVAADGDL